MIVLYMYTCVVFLFVFPALLQELALAISVTETYLSGKRKLLIFLKFSIMIRSHEAFFFSADTRNKFSTMVVYC